MIPPNKDTDLKFYRVDGRIRQRAEALDRMTSDADLVVWVAGNQFFAMDAVIAAFQHPQRTANDGCERQSESRQHIDDFVRSDIRTALPNPVNEGVMQFYARKVLERHAIRSQIAGGRECVACQTA